MLNRYIYVLFLAILIASFFSCNNSTENSEQANIISDAGVKVANISSQELLPKTFVQWIQNPENGLRKEKTIDDMVFSAQYKPYEYIVCMEERTEEIEDSILKSKMNELNEMQYFDFKMMLKEEQKELLKYKITSQDEYDKRVKYFAFQMQQDIQLIEGNDTLSCELFHFERAYDLSPSAVFLLAFPKTTYAGDKTLVVYDRIFNKGYIKFNFNNSQLQNLPKIKTI